MVFEKLSILRFLTLTFKLGLATFFESIFKISMQKDKTTHFKNYVEAKLHCYALI